MDRTKENTELQDSLFDFAQHTYEMEIERKDRINASLSFPAGIVALLAGVVALFAEKVPQSLPGFAGAIFVIAAGSLLIAIVIAIYFLLRAYIKWDYYYLSTPLEWREQVHQLEDYYQHNDRENIQELIEVDIKRNLLDQYEESAHKNFENNQEKLSYLNKAKIAITCGLVALLISSVPYYLLTQGEKTHRVHVTNLKEINMTKQQDNSQQSSQSRRSETQHSGEASGQNHHKPADLKPRVLRENDSSLKNRYRDATKSD
ncbi:MAG: hypothetical protein OXN20_03060 [Gemmatimonadota bacterium]|nr:hypothetical protein [Gemmatimonadota bacterium]